MARWDFKLPDIGEGVSEGEIVAWLVQPGDSVREDQPLIELMTDKATVTITAPRAGIVLETHGRLGEVVAVHSVLVVFDVGGEGAAPGAIVRAAAPSGTGSGRTNGHAVHEEGTRSAAAGGGGAPAPADSREAPLATPATRRHARELGVDLRSVPATGPQGRVTRDDVEAYARSRSPGAEAPVEPPRAPAPGPTEGPPSRDTVREPAPPMLERPVRDAHEGGAERRVPFVGMRRKIAQKMSQSKATAAHFTFVEECDVSELKALRERLLGPAQQQGVKLTFLPFVVRAVVAALRRHPVLASTLDDEAGELVYRSSYGIGIATATPAGLMVPVVKEAHHKNLLEIAREIDRVVTDARAGRSKLEDLQGSTFTVTSLGTQGGLLATPIINYPEVAILGVHQMKQRPVVRDGKIVVGEVMNISLSFDHRVVDGHVGAAFAYDVLSYLEHPERLLLE